MTVVESVNTKTGIVVLKATDVEAIPESEAGQPNGVATLNGSGTLSEAQLPSSVASSSTSRSSGQGYVWSGSAWVPESLVINRLKELGEVSGNVTPNISEGNAFTLTAVGNVVIKPPENAINVREVIELELIENAAGGHTFTFSEVEPIGEAPILNTASNAVNLVQFVTSNRGATWRLIGLQVAKEGAKGEKGTTGATGSEGVSAIKTLTLARNIETYLEPGVSTKEKRNALAESVSRAAALSGFQLTSGVPFAMAIPVAANTTINGVAFFIVAEEAETPTRTHLWVALLNEKGEVVKRGLDYTSKPNTGMGTTTVRALRLESAYKSGSEPELLYGVICEVMSAGKPIQIGHAEGSTPAELEPCLGLKLEGGLTTPASLKEKPTQTNSLQRIWMALV